MANILILTEKRYISKRIIQALENESLTNCIIVKEIGGHVYTKDEKLNIEKLSLETMKSSSPIVLLPDGEIGHLFGEKQVAVNLKAIQTILNMIPFDIIINACDNDKNGLALFDYTKSHINFCGATILNLELKDLEDISIQTQYADVLETIDIIKLEK